MADQRCPECDHSWSEHDLYGCARMDGCLRIDRDWRFDKALKERVPV